jgi:Icc-related predicted phosphoesterase
MGLGEKMRIYYTTDLHGSDKCWKKFLATPKYYKADVVVIGGDITGKVIVPIIMNKRGRAEATFMGRKRKMKKEKDIETFKQVVANAGQYPLEVTEEEYAEYQNDPSKLENIFRQLLTGRVEEWVKLADERLADQNVRCFVAAGNDDIFEIDDVLAKSETIEMHDGRLVEFDGFQMFGMGYANMTPWNCPRDISEEELGDRLEEMASHIKNWDLAVLDLHAPPYDTGLDSAPELTDDMRMALDATGQPKMVPVGSKAVRDFIIKYQPLVSMHGHIHESPGIKKMGKTTALNPGSEYAEGILRGAVIDLDPKEGLVNVNLVTG